MTGRCCGRCWRCVTDYLRVPNDDYLKGFRQRAGKPAPGADLGGWYTPGTFHVFGQVLSGLARMHAATGDEACREKLNALIREWSRCIEPDGYFYSTKPPAPPHYIYEKMAGGLLDAHLYAGNPEALALLDRITGWAEKNLDHSNPYVFNTMAGITEWYTLSENLYRAYLVTGQARYRDYARTWEYTNYWNLFAEPGKDIFKPVPGLSRLQPCEHAQRRGGRLRGHRRAPLPRHHSQCLRLPAGAPGLCHRRLRPGRTHGAGPAPAGVPRHDGEPLGNPMLLLGGVQAGQIPDELHRRRPLRRLGRAPADQRHRRHPAACPPTAG